VPVNEKGEYDLSIQKQIASKYEEIESIKKSLSEELHTLVKSKLSIE
jgi:hypothetical protein